MFWIFRFLHKRPLYPIRDENVDKCNIFLWLVPKVRHKALKRLSNAMIKTHVYSGINQNRVSGCSYHFVDFYFLFGLALRASPNVFKKVFCLSKSECRILNSLYAGLQIKSGLRIPLLWIPDSNNQILLDSGFCYMGRFDYSILPPFLFLFNK